MKKFDNYKSNLAVLSHAGEQDLSNEFIIGGIIDKFSLQFELGWKVLKELLRYEGVAIAATGSPREILKAAYRFYPCMDESIWLGMLAQRNNMAHMYDGTAAVELAGTYILEFFTGSWPWNTYSDYDINFQARIALSPSLRFGMGGLLFLYFVQSLYDRLLSKPKPKTLNIITIAVLVTVVTDFALTLIFRY